MSPTYVQGRNGYEPYAVHSLTGAPYTIYDIININSGSEQTNRDVEHIENTWRKLNSKLKKGQVISVTSRLPNQRENLRIGDAINKFGIWTAQRYLTSQNFQRGSDLNSAHDFSATERIDEIISIFSDIGLQLFEEVVCDGQKKLLIKRGMAQKLKHNLKGYVNKGIWSSHNYAVVSLKEVKDEVGKVWRLIKLRNCWQGEDYTGNWSKYSTQISQGLRESLELGKGDDGDFFMDIVEFMQIFECMNVYKINPLYIQQSVPIEMPTKTLLRSVIRISVKVKGKYTFSVDQKDLHMYKDNEKYRHNRVKVTLGILEKNQFQILSHTSSTKLRNTYIRKVIEKGEYYVLVEQDTRGQSPPNANPSLMFSSYGPKSVGISVIESSLDFSQGHTLKNVQLPEILIENIKQFNLSPISPPSNTQQEKPVQISSHPLYDYLLYQSWRNYSQRRPGLLINECNINFFDGSWEKINLYQLNVPDMVVYAFHNPHSDFGVELKANIMGIHGSEAIGPGSSQICENDILTNSNFGSQIIAGHHIFDLGSNEGTDIFIIRDLDDTELDLDSNRSTNFKIESVVGVKYKGIKTMTAKAAEIYDWLVQQSKLSPGQTDMEKDSELFDTLGVYEPQTGQKYMFKNEEILLKTKRVVSRMGQELTEDQLEIVDDQNGLAEKLKNVAESSRRNDSMLNQRTRHKSLTTTIIQQEVDEKDRFVFEEEANVLQVGDPAKTLSRRAVKTSEDATARSKTQAGEKKRSKSILKNSNQNKNLEFDNVHNQPLKEELQHHQELIQHEKIKDKIL